MSWGCRPKPAMRLYQALFLSIPFFGIAACLVLIPRGLRWLLLFPAISALALVISALGFPTETVLTLSAFWPALFGYRYADGRAGSAVLTLFCTLLFVFFSSRNDVRAAAFARGGGLCVGAKMRTVRSDGGLIALGNESIGVASAWVLEAWVFAVRDEQPGYH